MADNLCVVKSRRTNRCYVGRFRSHVVVSELSQLACNSFCFHRFGWSNVNVSIKFSLSLSLIAPPLWVPPLSDSASSSVSGIS